MDFTYGSTTNNGNILSQTITVPTVGTSTGFTAVQTYTYDSLNRIESAEEMPYGWSTCTSDPTKCWKQTFTFDRYGNRRFDESNTTMPASFSNPDLTNPTFDAANNRMATGQGWSYDSAGNVTVDPDGRQFTYDGENKQTDVKNSENEIIGEYFYDGDGRRVKKITASETTIFVYDAAGKQIAEYSTIVEDKMTAKVNYLTNDHLGSPRINTDASGNVTARHDYHPFGEEISTGERLSHPDYTPDGVRQQFTGYERDDESELDFAQARMYGSSHGRFTSPDLLAGGRGNPQSLNRYVYVGNRPLVFVDPKGLEWVNTDGRPVWVKPDEYAKQKEEGTALSLWDQERMKYDSGEGTVTLDPRGPNSETPWGWTLDSVAVGDPNESALDPSVPGENRAESTATDGPPMIMSSSGDPRRNWYLIYEDARARRSRAQALFPDTRGLDAERHRWATRQTALRWGTGTARTLGLLNEFQGFIFHDLEPLAGDALRASQSGMFISTRTQWAFQWSDLQHNERGIAEANTIMNQPKNNVPK